VIGDTRDMAWWKQRPFQDLLRVIILAVSVLVALAALRHF